MRVRKQLWLWLTLAALGGYACDDDENNDNNNNNNNNEDVDILANPLKGGRIAINDAKDTVAVANKASGSVSLFDVETFADDAEPRATVTVGNEPNSLAWAPDNTTLYVVNRADGDVSVIENANTAAAQKVGDDIAVGSEPVNIVLSPTGKTAYVSNFADGTLSVIDTATRTVKSTKTIGGEPYGLCMTNDGDQSDNDETLFVTDFFSNPNSGEKEATDTNRTGIVYRVSTADMSVTNSELPAVDEVDIKFLNDRNLETGAFANQLYSCTVEDDMVLITTVNASPAPVSKEDDDIKIETDFHQNVHGAIYVLSAGDSAVEARTYIINEFIDQFTPAEGVDKRFAAVPADIGCTNGICYVAVTTADMVVRFNFRDLDNVSFGPELGNVQFIPSSNNATVGNSPMGLAVIDGSAFVYNEVNRSAAKLDLAQQTLVAEASSADVVVAEEEILNGNRFFNTGRGIWSNTAWVGCLACHPDGTTDNVTWSFPTGPRQTVDVSPSFDKSGLVHRIFNWTAIFDEVCDFELNTRDVAGGDGAIVRDDNGTEVPISLRKLSTDLTPDDPGPGEFFNQFNEGSACDLSETGERPDEWLEIEAYIKSIRTPTGRTADAALLTQGRQLFGDLGCDNCHSGELWTIAERYYTPDLDNTIANITFADAGINQAQLDALQDGLLGNDDQGNEITETSKLLSVDEGGLIPKRHACAVREVGTFDVDGPLGIGADELRQAGAIAQGQGGFNVPSLLGVNLGAPYLHNGAAASLDELFGNDFSGHLASGGNNNASLTEAEKLALIAFVKSIDDDTAIFPIPTGQNICPTNVEPALPPPPPPPPPVIN